jgi:16S rRNA G1207 methylase RsmC
LKKLDIETDERAVFNRDGVFKPTATTRLLAKSALSQLPSGGSLLDLGCGSGIIGLSLALRVGAMLELSMSDVSPAATGLARENARALDVEADIRTGSLFDPWEAETFDYIVSDVSGVIPELGARFGWFEGVPNESGETGTGLAVQVIRGAASHLRPDGKLVFPIISLSAERLIIKEAQDNFLEVKILEEVRLPLALKLSDAQDLIASFPDIRVESLGGVQCFFTTAYLCARPKGKK